MLTQERLKEMLFYDQETGIFIRKIAITNFMSVGDVAGSPDKHGYLRVQIDGKGYKCHRLAWLYMHGFFPEKQIDHKNLIKSDNRISNLRNATPFQNQQNRSKNKNNTSGFKNVTFHKRDKKWQANFRSNGECVFLGYFDSAKEASQAHAIETQKRHGEFSRTQ